MKKIVLSLTVIAVVSIAVVGATRAFFSDTETSTGNTFTAGAIDLTLMDGDEVTGTLFNSALLSDLKPGDSDTEKITLKVDSNDAWLCGLIKVTDSEDGINEPEAADGDSTTDVGELGADLSFFWWIDADEDGAYDGVEKILYSGPHTVDEWLAVGGNTGKLPVIFADSSWNYADFADSNNPIPGGTPQNIAVGWCFGNLGVSEGTDGFTCGGAAVDNQSQGDGLVLDMAFYAEQERNNPDFQCSGWASDYDFPPLQQQ